MERGVAGRQAGRHLCNHTASADIKFHLLSSRLPRTVLRKLRYTNFAGPLGSVSQWMIKFWIVVVLCVSKHGFLNSNGQILFTLTLICPSIDFKTAHTSQLLRSSKRSNKSFSTDSELFLFHCVTVHCLIRLHVVAILESPKSNVRFEHVNKYDQYRWTYTRDAV